MKEFFFTLIVFCLSHPKPYVSHLISLIFFHFSSSFIYFSPTLFSWETCASGLWLGKYMVLESYISEIWDFPVNGENIIFLMHDILFTYAFPKFPFNVSLLVATDVHVNKKVCNLINTKIWNLKLSTIFPKPSSSHFGLTLVCLSSWANYPNSIVIFRKPSTKPKLTISSYFFIKGGIFLRFLENKVELPLVLD